MIVYCKQEYLYLDAVSETDLLWQAEEKIEAYVARRGYTPKVLLIKGIGMVAVGDHARNADIVTDVFLDAMKIAFWARAFGGAHPMEREWIDFIDNWEVENYRRQVAAGNSRGRVEGKTIIVTGAAQGFGEGIARELLLQGANIVVADLNEETGGRTTAALNAIAGNNSVLFVKTNVADLESVQGLVRATVIRFGALDAFISNAGVVRAGNLEDMTLENMQFVSNINYMGYFVCAKAASHVMKLQTAQIRLLR